MAIQMSFIVVFVHIAHITELALEAKHALMSLNVVSESRIAREVFLTQLTELGLGLCCDIIRV